MKIPGYPVTVIGNNSAGRTDRDRQVPVALPATATRAGFVNFQDCVNLESLGFPPRLTSVGDSAFNAANPPGESVRAGARKRARQ